MPRAVVLGVLGLLLLGPLGAQVTAVPSPVWTLVGPASVVPGQSFLVRAEVRLPVGWYQDAQSDFLQWEPRSPLVVIDRTASEPARRADKASYTGTFTLTRTVVLPENQPPGRLELVFDAGWQICQIDGVCLLPVQTTKALVVEVAGEPPVSVFWTTLFAAFLGGLLLNLMPCVFPVLALKALALTSGGLSGRAHRAQAWAFAGGSWLAVSALGLAVAAFSWVGQRLDWGFPFQQPVFVGALAAVFFFLTLSLWGWLPWSGLPFQPSGAALRPPSLLRSAGGGVLLVLAAAPCTAPLLGPALGFALARPAFEIPLYFAAIGLGLALPLLVLGLLPAWGKFLPRPGPWMGWVEKGAGVLLAATTVYLLSILVAQTGVGLTLGVVVALVLSAGVLILARKSSPTGTKAARLVAGLVLVTAGALLSVPLLRASRPEATKVEGWLPFSEETLASARNKGEAVLVDATAAWCATCQVNEAAVLHRPDVAAELERLGVVRLRADYTRPDPRIQAWLASVERAGLPVYALYRPGEPVYLFPELLTDENFTRRLPALLGDRAGAQ